MFLFWPPRLGQEVIFVFFGGGGGGWPKNSDAYKSGGFVGRICPRMRCEKSFKSGSFKAKEREKHKNFHGAFHRLSLASRCGNKIINPRPSYQQSVEASQCEREAEMMMFQPLSSALPLLSPPFEMFRFGKMSDCSWKIGQAYFCVLLFYIRKLRGIHSGSQVKLATFCLPFFPAHSSPFFRALTHLYDLAAFLP